MRGFKLIISLFFALFVVGVVSGYSQEERRDIRKGNKKFYEGKFNEAEVDYLRAIDIDSTSMPAIFNLGNAFYKQGQLDEALKRYTKLAENPIPNKHTPDLFYNSGNALFYAEKYEEAAGAYMQALRMNPSDTTAKFNLAYALLKLQQQQQQQQEQNQDQNQDNQDQNQEQNQDNQNQDQQNQDQNQDNQNGDDKKDGEGDDKKDGEGDKKEEQEGEGKPQEVKLSKEQAEKLLEAIQANEDKTQEKLKDKKKGVIVVGSGKNW